MTRTLQIPACRKFRSSRHLCWSCHTTLSAVGCLNRVCSKFVGDKNPRDKCEPRARPRTWWKTRRALAEERAVPR